MSKTKLLEIAINFAAGLVLAAVIYGLGMLVISGIPGNATSVYWR